MQYLFIPHIMYKQYDFVSDSQNVNFFQAKGEFAITQNLMEKDLILYNT